MKLERTLIELSTLVDYGCKYLAEREVMKAEFHSDEWINVADVVNYVVSNYDVDDVFDDDEISEYVNDNIGYFLDSVSLADFMEANDISTADVLDGIDLSEYMRVMGMTDEDVLDCLPNSSIIDYVNDRWNADDVFDMDEFLNESIENMSLERLLKGASAKDIWNAIDSPTYFDMLEWVKYNVAVAEMVEWQ